MTETLTLIKPTRQHAAKVLEVVNHGLCKGVGTPEPGKMCVEAAVCFAFGLPHGDNPPCVGDAVRSFKIALNDSDWSSDQARAKGMRRIAIAQLGSNEIDQNLFVKELALATIRKIVPLALRTAAGMKGNAAHKNDLEANAVKCEAIGDDLTAPASRAASCAASCAARAASYAARAARAASYAASYAASCAARAASDAASYAARAARAASYAASDAASCAARAASYAASDAILCLMAEIGVEALKKAGSPGCAWLDLAPMEAA